ncbi:MAG TPA: hypothetical protein VKH44_00830 [Pirellulaceae bacterium]|nr:hypothetical protein [Pirellulaceae bacterium]
MAAEFVGLVLLTVAVGQVPENPEATDAAREERLQFIKQKAAQFELFRESAPQQPVSLKENPLLRYSIPERDNGTWDGATFLWTDGARPIAAIAVGIRRPNDAVFRELTSLCTEGLVCRKLGNVVWSAKSGGLMNQPLANSPPPAATESGRLTQMRSLARRFSATCVRRGDATELRLMPQPLYRFNEEKQGIIDGALFGLVVSNDAEILLLLEAVQAPAAGQAGWRFSLARMSSLDLSVRLGDTEIWSAPRFYSIPAADRKTGPYVEAAEGSFTSQIVQPAK